MKNTYSWGVSQLETHLDKDGKKDVVFAIHWQREASSNGCYAKIYGVQQVDLDPAAPFTPFDSLSKTQVQEWLVRAMGENKISDIDARLDEQLAALISPTTATPPLPWEA
jgi:hypothetical protein